MDYEEKIACIRLIRTRNIGPMTFRLLMQRYGTARDALEAVPKLAKRGGRNIIPASRSSAIAELKANEAANANLIFKGSDDYPARLAQYDDAPPILSVRGNIHLFHRPMIAIVGARNASINAQRHAESLAEALSNEGYVIVSGLARGIDTSVHNGALRGGTVAVIAGGIDIVYPAENKDLHQAIAEQGAIIAEMPPGTKPTQRHFPTRNRIIASMSLGVVVVEAAARSGSLITAREAGERGAEVMAIPGSPLDPRASGCNRLIRDGATLIQNHHDIIEALSVRTPIEEPKASEPIPIHSEQGSEEDMASTRSTILNGLSAEPIEIDELLRWCKTTPAIVYAVILELEIAGHLLRHHGNRVSKILTE